MIVTSIQFGNIEEVFE